VPEVANHHPAQRVLVALRRGREATRRRNVGRTRTARLGTALVCLVAALLIAVSAVNARGSDLRPARTTDLVSLVQDQSRRNAELTGQLTGLRAQVDALTDAENGTSDLPSRLERQEAYAGLTAVTGPAVTVTLDDAPASVAADGVDPDLLVVHQQDIQAVVNALWSGGAEAMTIQGQRVISTTGVKCVGNTVVLHGIPYAPPYVISALGSHARLEGALAASEPVRIYQQYVTAYGLVYDQRTQARATFPAHEGSLDLEYAAPLDGSGSGSATPR
jgi:uncharacterized protein YlxW (UPF0749 family)